MNMTPEQREALNIHTLAQMQERALGTRPLHVLRQVATASKHWTISRRPDHSVEAVVAADPEWRIWFEDDQGELAASTAFDLALSFWTEFIYQNAICGE